MYKCPKCGNYMQWRPVLVYGDDSYWICSQCGYSPSTVKTNSTMQKEDDYDHI